MKPLFYPATKVQLEAIVRAPAGTYIFRGPRYVGKHTAALWLAGKVLCASDICGTCRDCLLIKAGAHPSVTEVAPDGKTVGIEQVKSLQGNLKLSGYAEGPRFAVIDEADTLTIEAQNALLKLLEEPPADTAIILISHGGDVLLPTIQSRSRIVNFTPLAPQEMADRFDPEVARWSAGLPGLATSLQGDESLRESYQQADGLVEGIVTKEPFDRLVAAAALSEDPVMLELFLSRLSDRLRQDLRRGAGVAQSRALERFRHHKASNVPVKAALESLVLEL